MTSHADKPAANFGADLGAPSLYQRLLGQKFCELDPHLQGYFGAIPEGHEGFGKGIYEQAGLRLRLFRPLFALLSLRRIAFAEHGTDVPFSVRNTSHPDGTLTAVRTFEFPTTHRSMEDSMSVVDGYLIDRIGKAGEFEAAFSATVTDGKLLMVSRRLTLCLGRLRLRLPPVAKITLEEKAEPTPHPSQRVSVRITAPIIGEIYSYTGTFTYAVQPVTA